MKAYRCRVCDQRLFFENDTCLRCSTRLGYSRSERALVPLDVLRTVLATQIIDGLVQIIGLRDGRASFAKTPPPIIPIDPELLVDSRFALLEATRRIDELNARTHS